MKNYLLKISYDGTDYHGWQRQKGQKTVQQAVEEAVAKLIGVEISVTASGRTDEGVHAMGQALSFACETSVPCEKFAAALNTYLPDDIRAVNCIVAPDGFCARKSAKRKTYVYRFYLSDKPLPHMERYALRVDKPLDIKIINKACAALIGRHDFVNFHCVGSSAKTTVRNIFSCRMHEYPACGITPPIYELEICGDGFLYKMVRLLAGALIGLSLGKISYEDFIAALGGDAGKVRKVPLPSKGLILKEVEYDRIH